MRTKPPAIGVSSLDWSLCAVQIKQCMFKRYYEVLASVSGLANCTHSRQYRIVTCRVCSRSRVPYAAISHCDPAQPPAYRNAGIQSIHAFVHSWHFSIADIVPGHGSEVLKLPFFFFLVVFSLSDTEVKPSVHTLRTSGDALLFSSPKYFCPPDLTHWQMSSQVYASCRNSFSGSLIRCPESVWFISPCSCVEPFCKVWILTFPSDSVWVM